MKNFFVGLLNKTSLLWKSVFVAHAKVCIIAGAVAVSGTAGTVTAVEVVKHVQKKDVVQAQETEEQTDSNGKLGKLVGQMGINKDDSQYDGADEEPDNQELFEAIEEAVAESEEPIPILDMDQLDVGEDTSSEPAREETPVEDSSSASSSEGVYEVNQLAYGIDVSHWNNDAGGIDWTAVAADGITFAMIKCGGGEIGHLYEDVKFEENIQGALANGIQVGIYFYAGATDATSAYEEASFCINLINKYQITYPVAYDWELNYGDYDSVTQACETFCNVVQSYGYTPMVYSNKNRFYNMLDGAKLGEKYKIWVAQYYYDFYPDDGYARRWEYGDVLSNYENRYDMWQYTSKGTVSGINGYVDMNIAFFGYANYTVNGQQEASITVQNKNITRYYGHDTGKINEGVDFMAGVKGTNSIGYSANVDYEIYDSSGNEIDEDDALDRPGKYTVRYSFKDPKSGKITNEATLNVIEVTAKLVTPDIQLVLGKDKKIQAGFSFTAGVSGSNSLSETAALTGYTVIKQSISGGETQKLDANKALAEEYDFDNYTYSVEYTFSVPKDGNVSKTAKITKSPKSLDAEKETETESGSENESTSGSQAESGTGSQASTQAETANN